MKREIQPELSVQIGQARMPKDIAISRHLAQFDTHDHFPESTGSEKRNRDYYRRMEKENKLNDLVAPVKNSLQPGDSLEPIMEDENIIGWKIIRKKKAGNKK